MGKRMPAKVERELYHIIGHFVIRYGYLDAAIATLAAAMFEDFGGHHSEAEPVKVMTRRLNYIGKCIRAKAKLKGMAGSWASLRAEIDRLDIYRQYLFHGYLEDYFPATKAYRFIKLDVRGDKSGYDRVGLIISHDELLHLLEASRKVILSLRRIGRKVGKLASGQKRTK